MIRRPPRSTRVRSSAASDVYKRQGEICGAFCSCDLVEARDDGLAQAVHGECDALESIGGDLAQAGFEFGKELFDGVEVWTIGWNVEQRCTARCDRFFDSLCLVNAGIVHEHDITSLQCRSEELFDIGFEHLTGHRAFEHEGSVHTVMT